MYYRLIPFKRTFDTFGLIYHVPKVLENDISPGNIVVVTLKDTQIMALACNEIKKWEINCKYEDIKDIISILDDFKFLTGEQIQIIDFIAKYYITPIHHALALYFPRNLQEKIIKQTVKKIKIRDYNCNENINISLSENQQGIFDAIYKNPKQKKHLIYGVTGSGKTQIYMKIIEKNLQQGKQSLLLIPEIILTSQIGERVGEVFWKDVIILHSGISAAKKSQYWMEIHSWKAKIIIGTRSALFYPYNNLASIILDEEHDRSYISDSAPRYHTLEVAETLSRLIGSNLILWSGTPRVTTFYRWLKWEFQVLQLLEKYK